MPIAAGFPISSPYGARKDPKTGAEAFHYGIDFACPVGTPVVACLDGVIDGVGWENPLDHTQGFGLRVRQRVSVDGKLYFIFYPHLSETSVEVFERVIAGTRVGLSGNSGKTTGPHLHLEIRPIGGKGIPFEFLEGTA